MYAFMTAAVLLVAKVKRIPLSVADSQLWKILALIGLGETVAYLSISLGYSRTSLTSVVAVLSGAFSVPTIILARTFLKEKVAMLQTIGSVVVVSGIVLLAAQR
jgi:drug/metabolite transporter (DMT)-like permease